MASGRLATGHGPRVRANAAHLPKAIASPGLKLGYLSGMGRERTFIGGGADCSPADLLPNKQTIRFRPERDLAEATSAMRHLRPFEAPALRPRAECPLWVESGWKADIGRYVRR